MTHEDPIVIVNAKRTPIGHFNGYYHDLPAPKLAAQVIKNMIAHNLTDHIDEVIMGCVLPAGLGQAPARQATLLAKLPSNISCTTINKMCGSGMKAVMMAFDAIKAKNATICIAGGMENMSRAPYLLTKARFGYRLGDNTIVDHMTHDGLTDAYGKLSMGAIAEKCAEKFNITRKQQDDYAIRSIERATDATHNGAFKAEISPVLIHEKKETITLIEDEGIIKANIEKIPQLESAFIPNGTITAANASSISDGAAALVLMPLSQANTLNLKPLVKIVGHQTIAQEPEWFTTAPAVAIQSLLKKIDWDINTVDLFEINEAFAVVVLAAMQTLDISAKKVNIHGGACILGHPIGASGARILVTLIHALIHTNKKRGIAALCIGGGEATAIAIERI